MNSWKHNEYDKNALRDLADFLPSKVFDAHVHIYRTKDLNQKLDDLLMEKSEVSIGDWIEFTQDTFGDVPLGGLFMPFPSASGDIEASNNYLTAQLNDYNHEETNTYKGSILIAPGMSIDHVYECLECPHIVGFKPYHVYSTQKPTFQSNIDGFIPEWAYKIADEKGLAITLHMVKDGALADEDNYRHIVEKCTKYPNMKLILAHAARGFHGPNTVKGIKQLKGLQNVYFDLAAICEAAPIEAILREFGPTKIFWGTDLPVSIMRGKYLTLGDSFLSDFDGVIKKDSKIKINLLQVMIESLRAFKEAAHYYCLNKDDLEDIFYNNAAKLFGIIEKTTNLNQDLYKHAKTIIPAGTQLLSKRPEMLAPDQWPAYFKEAKGCEVIDIDGKHYYDMYTNGIGACMLGFADPDVTKAVIRRINLGSMCTLNPPEEVELAERLIDIHPWAQQVRYARTGGETAAVAVRIARATTQKSMVAISGYHGWHDWYIAGNLGETEAQKDKLLENMTSLGVPKELRKTTIPFLQNKGLQNADNMIKEFDDVIREYGDKLAAVVMEPCRHHDPAPGYLEHIRKETKKRGIILIFDEITIGFRRNFGGAHLGFGINPDMAVFAKSLGNGHPVGAVIGTSAAMDGANDAFISSTYWTESVGPVAALATIKKHESMGVARHVDMIGRLVQGKWAYYGKKHNLPMTVEEGYPCLANFVFNHSLSKELTTLYTQQMLKRGFLANPHIYTTLAHTPKIVDLYGDAIDEVFGELSLWLQKGTVSDMLEGPVKHSGFQRLL